MSGFGAGSEATPNLAALGERASVFLQARSETNVTNPSHMTILSGVSIERHGVVNNKTPLPEEIDTLPEAFSRRGFATAAFVSAAHLWKQAQWRGFDHVDGADARYAAKQVTDRALAWLAPRREDRFFLWVHYFDPHMPYIPTLPSAKRFYSGDPRASDGGLLRESPGFLRGMHRKEVLRWLGDARDPDWPKAMYAAALFDADRELARLLAAVPAESTAVVVTADHGEGLGEHDVYYNHTGLYETQLRIPLLIALPGQPPARHDFAVSNLDLAPTLAEVFGLELHNPPAGASLVSALAGEPNPVLAERSDFFHLGAHRHGAALRDGPWKLVWQRRLVPPIAAGTRLHHVERDPGELEDLAAAQPERVRAMQSALEARVAQTPEPATPELDPEALEQLRALGYAEP